MKAWMVSFLLLFFLLTLQPFSASPNVFIQEVDLKGIEIEFPSSTLTIKEFLFELSKIKELNAVYGSENLNTQVTIKLSSRKLTLFQAIQEIQKQAPIEFVFDESHIIVRNRKLQRSYTVSGTVRDFNSKEPLIAATVFAKGTTKGVTADFDGNFSLELAPGVYTIVFQFIGYKERWKEVKLYQDEHIDIEMETKDHQLEAVNVVGSFGQIETIERGRAIETIKAADIERLNTNNVSDALHGTLAGVWGTKVSGAPGDHMKIRIRGISSIFGNTDPLFVVDGTIIPIVNNENLGVSDLNNHDIKEITVLKDAASSAMFGSLGANGVILIKTKSGGGPKKISANVKLGIQFIGKRYDLLGTGEFINNLKASDSFLGSHFIDEYKKLGNQVYPKLSEMAGSPSSGNWNQSSLFHLGNIQDYQVSGQGSIKTFDYYLAVNYFEHLGVVKSSEFNRFSFTANLSKTLFEKLRLGFIYRGSDQYNKNTLDNFMGNDVIFKGLNYEPSYAYTADTFFTKTNRLFYNDVQNRSVATLSSFKINRTILYNARLQEKEDLTNSITLSADLPLTKSLLIKSNFSNNFRDQYYSSSVQQTLRSVDFDPEQPYEMSMHELYTHESYYYRNFQTEVQYSRNFNMHGLKLSVQHRAYADKVKWETDSIENIDLLSVSPDNEVFMRGSQALNGPYGSVARKLTSLIGIASYNFRRTYFLSMIANYEKLREEAYVSNNTLYNSVAFTWNLSNQKILQLPSSINNLEVFINYGEAGNYPLNSLSEDLYDQVEYSVADTSVYGTFIRNLANRHLVNETINEINIGTNIGLNNDRFTLRADYYIKRHNNLLITRPIPYYYGGGTFWDNIGQMKNTGFELTLDYTAWNTEKSYLESHLSFSSNRQIISRLYNEKVINFNNPDVLIPDFAAIENQVLGSIIAYQYEGFWNDDFANSTDKKYVNDHGIAYLKTDIEQADVLTEKDKVIVGQTIPKFTYAWSTLFEYRNLSFEMDWYGVAGVQKFNATRAATYITGLNPGTKEFVYKGIDAITDHALYESSYFVEDASFLRLKNLRITHRVPNKTSDNFEIQYGLTFANLITITRYGGYDPEATIYTRNNFSDNAIDKGAYPNPLGIFLNMNIVFK